ncbi:hypothetical protein AQJ11_01470 [Streptomyces corchorusii]|uniref:Uncharacterized protein n=1 Tax=Streptomyces corchorusii TaxID=1903 RepID=A0A101QLT9_STRCK|nr:hypothetical protein [Streptomyces corchorusii]ALO93891.1 hypothetical protein SHL15_2749 [Streptomyces hygroscopicus subsp. limoneus]KUN32236.1 hypothetical protein AQJ11_01470 [Streptomyces corchorusii]
MSEQERGPGRGRAEDVRRRWVGGGAFVVGLVGALAFFAFFPGLPHVIDWGAVLVALGVGGLMRWGCVAWLGRRGR